MHRLTKRDWGNIQAAMSYIDAGEWPFEDPDASDDEMDARRASFALTLEKVYEREGTSVD